MTNPNKSNENLGLQEQLEQTEARVKQPQRELQQENAGERVKTAEEIRAKLFYTFIALPAGQRPHKGDSVELESLHMNAAHCAANIYTPDDAVIWAVRTAQEENGWGVVAGCRALSQNELASIDPNSVTERNTLRENQRSRNAFHEKGFQHLASGGHLRSVSENTVAKK